MYNTSHPTIKDMTDKELITCTHYTVPVRPRQASIFFSTCAAGRCLPSAPSPSPHARGAASDFTYSDKKTPLSVRNPYPAKRYGKNFHVIQHDGRKRGTPRITKGCTADNN